MYQFRNRKAKSSQTNGTKHPSSTPINRSPTPLTSKDALPNTTSLPSNTPTTSQRNPPSSLIDPNLITAAIEKKAEEDFLTWRAQETERIIKEAYKLQHNQQLENVRKEASKHTQEEDSASEDNNEDQEDEDEYEDEERFNQEVNSRTFFFLDEDDVHMNVNMEEDIEDRIFTQEEEYNFRQAGSTQIPCSSTSTPHSTHHRTSTPTVTTPQQISIDAELAHSLSLEEARPISPIPLGNEWIDKVNDPYLKEDDEDELQEENLVDSDDEERITVEEPKIKHKDRPNRVTRPFNLLETPNCCMGPDYTFVVPPVWDVNFPIMSKKGGAGFYHDGYIFYCRDEGKDLVNHHYNCEGTGCQMKITVSNFVDFVESNEDRRKRQKTTKAPIYHTCDPPNYLIKRLFRWFLRQYLVVTERGYISTTVIVNKMAGLSDIIKNQIGLHTETRNYFSGISRQSRAKGSRATSLKALTITPPLQVNKEGVRFLLFDSGEHESYRVICFATDANLLKLLEADQWLADATFRSSPRLFKQLWTIHARFGDRTLPMAYFIMTGATQAAYEDALIRFKAELDRLLPAHYANFPKKQKQSQVPKEKTMLSHPSASRPYYEDLLVDFELAQAKAFMSVFGGAPHGCYFHFVQCLERRLLKMPKLNNRVKTDATLKTKQAFKSFQALALIKKEKVNETLDAFLQTSYMRKHELIFRPFVEYFKRQWTGSLMKERHGRKIKGKITWSQEEYFKTDALRTTSSLEGWHKHMNSRINFTNPTFEHLIENLQVEQGRVEKLLFEHAMHDETEETNKRALKKYTKVKKVAMEPTPPLEDSNTWLR